MLLIAYPLDLFLSKTLCKINSFDGEFEVWNHIYNGEIDADIAVYGSSRAWGHFNTAIIEDSLQTTAYNFGINGHRFWIQYLRHLEYINHNPKPSTIIFSVESLSLESINDLFNLYQFLPYMLKNKNIYEYTNSFVGYKKHEYFVPLVRFAGKYNYTIPGIIGFMRNQQNAPMRYKGFTGHNRVWNDDLVNAMTENQSYRIKFNEDYISLFESFIVECKNSDINLILVYSPEYVDGQKYVENRDEAVSIYRNFAQKYDLVFLDFSDDEMSFNRDYFYNSTHLTREGANLFTIKLVNELKTLQSNLSADIINDETLN